MKTTKERIAYLRANHATGLTTEEIFDLLDDADELARLRNGLSCEIAMLRLVDEADRLTRLLNNGDDA